MAQGGDKEADLGGGPLPGRQDTAYRGCGQAALHIQHVAGSKKKKRVMNETNGIRKNNYGYHRLLSRNLHPLSQKSVSTLLQSAVALKHNNTRPGIQIYLQNV